MLASRFLNREPQALCLLSPLNTFGCPTLPREPKRRSCARLARKLALCFLSFGRRVGLRCSTPDLLDTLHRIFDTLDCGGSSVSMHVDPTLASTTVTLLNNGLNILKNARELTKGSSDTKLKDELSSLYDTFLELKERLLQLKDENIELSRKLNERSKVSRDSKLGYFFKEGETDPLCPKCYQSPQQLMVYLDRPYRETDSGRVTRFCRICTQTYTEVEGHYPDYPSSPWS